jgi:hypothetical protein
MSSLRLAVALALLAIGAASCGEAPPSYQVVSLGEARALLERPDVALLDAVGARNAEPLPLPRGIRWHVANGAPEPPGDLPEGAVLVVASDERIAHRSAAALAREHHRPVYVCIPRSAEERTSLYAHLPAIGEEPARGRDS